MASCGKVASHGRTPAEILREGYEEVLQVHSESYGKLNVNTNVVFVAMKQGGCELTIGFLATI